MTQSLSASCPAAKLLAVSDKYVPAGQFVQEAEPIVAVYVPAGQTAHPELLVVETLVPAGQGVLVGECVGFLVGDVVGALVGFFVGTLVGALVGDDVMPPHEADPAALYLPLAQVKQSAMLSWAVEELVVSAR